MRKVTLKYIRECAYTGATVDISDYCFDAVQQLVLDENGLAKIAYSSGVYGINGGIVQGHKTGTQYSILGRCATLFYIF